MNTQKRGVVGVLLLIVLIAFVLLSLRIDREEAPLVAPAPVSFCYSWTIGALPGIAAAEGYFADEGLAVELTPYPSGREALEAMLAGECELATAAETPIVFRAFQSRRFRILAATRITTVHNKIVARPDRGVASGADLRGRRIGVLRATAAHFFLYRYLLEHGLTTADVEVVFLPGIPDLEEAIAEGTIDALALWSPHVERIRDTLGERSVVLESPGLVMNTTNVVSTERFVAQRPRLVPPLLRALLRAQALVHFDSGRAINSLARVTGRSTEEVTANWSGELVLGLTQAFLLSLEDEARWALRAGLAEGSEIPNFLDLMYLEGLMQVAPQSVTVLH